MKGRERELDESAASKAELRGVMEKQVELSVNTHVALPASQGCVSVYKMHLLLLPAFSFPCSLNHNQLPWFGVCSVVIAHYTPFFFPTMAHRLLDLGAQRKFRRRRGSGYSS